MAGEKKLVLPAVLLITINKSIDLAIIISQQPTEVLVSVLPASEQWL